MTLTQFTVLLEGFFVAVHVAAESKDVATTIAIDAIEPKPEWSIKVDEIENLGPATADSGSGVLKLYGRSYFH